MVLHPCLGTPGRRCSELVRGGNRCPACAAATQRGKRARRAHGGGARYGAAEQARRRAAVEAHVRARGLVCPGWHRPAHRVVQRGDLTADHLVPVAAGGAEGGRLGVLCRPCNSAKGARGGG